MLLRPCCADSFCGHWRRVRLCERDSDLKTKGYADPSSVPVDGEVELREVLARVWQRRWFIVFVTAIAIVMAVTYLNFATYRYTVELKVAPIGEQSGGSLGALAESAGALGLDIPMSGRKSDIDVYLTLLKSQEVAERLMASPTLIHKIFPTEWDERALEWREPAKGLKTRVVAKVKEWLGVPESPWEPPTPRRVLSYLEGAIAVESSKLSPIVSVSVEHEDPEFAENLLAHVHDAADSILRERTLERTGKYIDYLQELLQRTTAAEYRKALVEALTAQEKLRMTAMADVPFSVDVVSGPVASAGPTSPRPAFLLLVAGVLGVTLSIFWVFLYDLLRQSRSSGVS